MDEKKSVFITIDNTIEDVVKYTDEGVEVFFKDDIDEFLELSDEEYKKLPKGLKTKYNTAKATHKLRIENAAEEQLLAEITLGARAANASQQLEIQNADPNLEYYLADKAKVGAKRAKGFNVDKSKATCFGIKPTNGVKYVGYNDELVMMSRPKELQAKREKQRKQNISSQFGDWMEATGMDYKE